MWSIELLNLIANRNTRNVNAMKNIKKESQIYRTVNDSIERALDEIDRILNWMESKGNH